MYIKNLILYNAYLNMEKLELIEHIATLLAMAISPIAMPLFRGLYSLWFISSLATHELFVPSEIHDHQMRRSSSMRSRLPVVEKLEHAQ